MTGKPITSKRKATSAKPSSAVRKSTTEKSLAGKAKENKKRSKAENRKTVVRDSFTMPQNDYAKIGELKQALLKAGMRVKKSELLRAGLHVLCKLSASQLKHTVTQMEQVKTGRPKKGA